MKHIKSFFNAVLLVTGLALLSGCDLFKSKMGCQSCEHVGGSDSKASSGQVLVTIDGKPAITSGDFETYWLEILKLEPQAAALVDLMPTIRPETFKTYLNERLIHEWLKREKKDQDPDYRKKVDTLRQQVERAVAAQYFQEYLVNKIDKSDAAVETFYKENREKTAQFQQPPFTKTIGGVKAMGVEFTNEAQAREFYKKAQKPGANFAQLAKDAKKTVDNFGGVPVNLQSRNVDSNIKMRLAEVKQVPGIEFVGTGRGGKWYVVKTIARTTADYVPFEQVKDAVKQVMLQTKFPQLLNQELDKLKQDYKVDDSASKTFFEEERKRKETELQDKLKNVQQKEEATESKSEAKAKTTAD